MKCKNIYCERQDDIQITGCRFKDVRPNLCILNGRFLKDSNTKTGKLKKEPVFCDENCNECPIIGHPNSRMLTKILNEARDKFGDEFYHIVQSNCPNLTCCYDCHIDDFCHHEGCELISRDEEEE